MIFLRCFLVFLSLLFLITYSITLAANVGKEDANGANFADFTVILYFFAVLAYIFLTR